MTGVSIIALVVIFWGLATGSRSVLTQYVARLSPPARMARFAAFALVPLYAANLMLVAIESRLQSITYRPWLKTLPIPVYDLRSKAGPHDGLLTSLSCFGLGILETAAMAIVVLSVRHRSTLLQKRSVIAIAVLFALLSLASPVMSTADPYEYAATGLLGLKAYAPPSGALAATVYAPYQKLIPLKGVIYGPLWVIVDVVQTSLGTSIYQKIEAMRVTNVAFIATFLALLGRAGLSRAAIVGFALNPCMWFYFVANPHADIEGLILLAGAYGCARRSRGLPSTLLLFAAGLIKLPFVFIGGAMLAPLAGARRRFAAWIAAIALVMFVSSLVPAGAYVSGLSRFAASSVSQGLSTPWLAAAGIMVGATVLVVALGRGPFGAAWLFAQLAIFSAPWYLFWGVPYAIATESIESYIVALPIAASLIETESLNATWETVVFFVILILGTDVYATVRRRMDPAPA